MEPGAPFYIFHADSEGYNFRGACHDVGLRVRQRLVWKKNGLVKSGWGGIDIKTQVAVEDGQAIECVVATPLLKCNGGLVAVEGGNRADNRTIAISPGCSFAYGVHPRIIPHSKA